jgi:hypothetical protein
MSKYEEERGTIQFTKTGYMQVIRDVRKLYNTYMKNVFQGALNIHAELAKIKGRGSNEKRISAFNEYTSGRKRIYLKKEGQYRSTELIINCELWWTIREEMFRGKGGTLCKPRKAAFKTLTNKETSFSIDYIDEADLSFSLDSLCMDWSVDRNNHAVDRAHENPIAKLVFSYLSNYKWRRNEGGTFYYDDEYSEDAANDNNESYSSSVSHVFGPIGKRAQDEERKIMLAMIKRDFRR